MHNPSIHSYEFLVAYVIHGYVPTLKRSCLLDLFPFFFLAIVVLIRVTNALIPLLVNFMSHAMFFLMNRCSLLLLKKMRPPLHLQRHSHQSPYSYLFRLQQQQDLLPMNRCHNLHLYLHQKKPSLNNQQLLHHLLL